MLIIELFLNLNNVAPHGLVQKWLINTHKGVRGTSSLATFKALEIKTVLSANTYLEII